MLPPCTALHRQHVQFVLPWIGAGVLIYWTADQVHEEEQPTCKTPLCAWASVVDAPAACPSDVDWTADKPETHAKELQRYPFAARPRPYVQSVDTPISADFKGTEVPKRCKHRAERNLYRRSNSNPRLLLGHSHPQRLHTVFSAANSCCDAAHHIMLQPAGGRFCSCWQGGAPGTDESSWSKSSSVARLLDCAGVQCSAAARGQFANVLRQVSANAAHGHVDASSIPLMQDAMSVRLDCSCWLEAVPENLQKSKRQRCSNMHQKGCSAG